MSGGLVTFLEAVNAFPVYVKHRDPARRYRGLCMTALLVVTLTGAFLSYFSYLVSTQQFVTTQLGSPLETGHSPSKLGSRLQNAETYDCTCAQISLCLLPTHTMSMEARIAGTDLKVTAGVNKDNACDEDERPTVLLDPAALKQMWTRKQHNPVPNGASFAPLITVAASPLCMAIHNGTWNDGSTCDNVSTILSFCRTVMFAWEFAGTPQGEAATFNYTVTSLPRNVESLAQSLALQFSSWIRPVTPIEQDMPTFAQLSSPSFLANCGMTSSNSEQVADAVKQAFGGDVGGQTVTSRLNTGTTFPPADVLRKVFLWNTSRLVRGCKPIQCTIIEKQHWWSLIFQAIGVVGGATTLFSIAIRALMNTIFDRFGIWTSQDPSAMEDPLLLELQAEK